MKKKLTIFFVMAGSLVLITKIYIDDMPDYGLRSRWKKLFLNSILSDRVPKISVTDAYKIKDSVLYVDTRSKKEYDVSHIEGSLFAGYKEFDWSRLKNISKNQRIITYCSIGKRSDVIGEKLMEAGYTHVQNMYGGIFEWINQDFPVVDNQENKTNKVHTYNRIYSVWLKKGEKIY